MSAPDLGAGPPPSAASARRRGAFRLRSLAFRREREKGWRELEGILDEAGARGTAGLAAERVARLSRLYRAALSSLGVARAISLDRGLLAYLEGLALRAHLCVYGTKRGSGAALLDFLARGFPRAVRAHALEVLVSAAVFLLGIAAAFALTSADMERYDAFVAPELAQGRDPGASTESLRAVLYGGGRRPEGDELSFFAAHLFTHNTKVGVLCFALGFAAGVPTLYLLFTNGLILGAMAALYHDRGLSLAFWGWILPHGVPELSAIVLCGAAGLSLGRGVVFPGRHARADEIALRGRASGPLILGTVALFLWAGLVEGFFRQLVHASVLRYAVAGLGAAGLAAWVLLGGREEEPAEAGEAAP